MKCSAFTTSDPVTGKMGHFICAVPENSIGPESDDDKKHNKISKGKLCKNQSLMLDQLPTKPPQRGWPLRARPWRGSLGKY
jgi:hypothetical protein